MLKKVISFSLYKAPDNVERAYETSYEKYMCGIEENIKLAKIYYSDWHIYIYHDECLDTASILQSQNYDKLEMKLIKDQSLNSMQWRFLPNDDKDVELFICRDLDSRITEREQVSVNEWIESKKTLHIMRDHPHHGYAILGGMWGMRSQSDFKMYKECEAYNISKNYDPKNDWCEKWWDMNFLRDVVYPKYISDSYINSETGHAAEDWNRPFTKAREDRKFVGEIYIDKTTRDYHYTLL